VNSTPNPQNPELSTARDRNAERLFLVVYALSALIVTIQRGLFGFANDFAIFRAAFWNLLAGRDVYVLRIAEAHDYFKYSPTFALLFAPFALPPFLVGLFLWNAANALALFFALRLLLPTRAALLAQALVFLSVLRNMQSSQSNALVAALIVLAFVSYRRGWTWVAATSVAAGTFIKIFPVAAGSFAISRPKFLQSAGALVSVVVVFALLPLLVVRPHVLRAEYMSWLSLQQREAVLTGASLMGLLQRAGLSAPGWTVQIVAIAVLIGVLLRRRHSFGVHSFNLLFLALVLVFSVLFNHRSEHQSAVIAVTGMVIWVLVAPRAGWRTIIFAIAFSLVCLTGGELTPHFIKQALTEDLRFTAPLALVWLAIVADLLRPALAREELAEPDDLDAAVVDGGLESGR
jgi:hypothetical protein